MVLRVIMQELSWCSDTSLQDCIQSIRGELLWEYGLFIAAVEQPVRAWNEEVRNVEVTASKSIRE